MRRRRDEDSEQSSEDGFDSGSESGSERELQEAFAAGLIKPGLNKIIEKSKKSFTNNVTDMKAKLGQMRLNLPWIESLDLVNDPAPMAPDVALQLQDTTQRQINTRANNAKLPQIDVKDDPVLNEFKRETLFHRQAQASVIEAIQKLHSLDVVTKRPDVYFAEMAKSDTHMQKVRQNLMAKQAGQERAEKVRQLRQQKKLGKQIQAQHKQQKAMEKKTMMDEIKKYRKGFEKNNSLEKKINNKSIMKKNMKNKKFGFGGKKRGSKTNTRESSSSFNDFGKNRFKKGGIAKNKNQFKSANKNKRPGKARRIISKSKKKSFKN